MAQYDVTNGETSTGLVLNNDSMYVSSGGTANETTLDQDGQMHVYDGALVSDTTANNDGQAFVSGGTVNDTTINSGGQMTLYGGVANGVVIDGGNAASGGLWVSPGGSANAVTVNSDGGMIVSSGGTATNILENGGFVNSMDGATVTFLPNSFSGLVLNGKWTTIHSGTTATDMTVNSGGEFYVLSGGSANDTTVNSGGNMALVNGIANSVTVNPGGHVDIASDGTATAIVENGGFLYWEDGATVTFLPNAFSGVVLTGASATVHSGTTATETTVNSGGIFEIYSGGAVNSVTVNPGGYVGIASDGTATDIVEKGGYIYSEDGATVAFLPNTISGLVLTGASATVHSGTTATETTVNPGGILQIFSGGTANSTTINATGSSGGVGIFFGGVANGVTVNTSGLMSIAGGTANSVTVKPSGVVWCFAEGAVNGVTVEAEGELDVFSGGTANSAAVNSQGRMYVYDGAANSVAVNTGILVIYSGGAVSGVELGSAGQAHVFGTLNDTTVSGGGYVGVSGGVANRLSVDDGSLWIAAGSANEVTVNSGGFIGVSSGGIAVDVVENGGFILLNEGALASFKPNSFSGAVLNGTLASLHSGTTATDTTINSEGILQINLGGLANNTTVNAGGTFLLVTNGTANNVTFNSGCQAELSAGGRLTGKVTFESGAVISAMEESILDFDLTRASAGTAALVNDLSFIPKTCLFTLTVGGNEAEGTYYLADGAAGFDTGIYVVNPDWTQILGVVVPNSIFVLGTNRYTLILADDVLSVTVNFVAPNDVYVNSEWADLPNGTVVPVADETNASIGYDAFADVNDAFAMVSEEGKVHVVGGSVSFNGAVDKSVSIGEGVTLTGKAAFNSPAEIDGTVVFDTADAADGPQFTGFDNVELGENAKFTLTAAPGAVGTSITLATGATSLFKHEVNSDDFDFVVGAPSFYVAGGIESYVLDLDANQNLVLSYVACENKSDGDAKNGYLVKKKVVNPHIGELQSNRGDEFNRVLLDDKGTVLENGNYNFVGGDDKADYAKITMASAAKLRFSVKTKNADDKVKLSLVSYDAATGKAKTLKSAAASKGKEGLTAAVFVDPNDPKTAGLQYFVAVENSGKTNVFYNVELTADSVFYVDADDGHNNSLVEKKVLNPYVGEFADTAVTSGEKTFIRLDTDDFAATDHGDYANWVGFGDDADFARISPDAPAILNFTLNGKCDPGAAPASLKFVVYSLTLNSKGVWTQTEIKSKTLNLKSANSVSTGILYLNRLNVPEADKNGRTGYYVSVQSTNAKKGGEAYYSVTTTGDLYEDADVSVENVSGNGWMFNKKGNAVNEELEKTNVSEAAQSEIVLDDGVDHGKYANFVGFGDEYDYAELIVESDGLYNFRFDTTGKAKFTVYSMTRKNGKWTQKALGSQTVKDVNGTTGATLKKDVLLTATNENVRYFVLMQALDTKKNPEVYYNVSATTTAAASNADALAMPETDALNVTAALSFGTFDADALADASAASLADLDGKSGWLNAATLA